MIDIHSHILPGVDDGSKNLDESLGLLKLLAEQGVTHSIATPHFYADCDTPERFFIRREDAWQKLHPALTPELPSVSLGAEIYYYRGISQMEQLRQFCIENSNFLLLEMPFYQWPESIWETLYRLLERRDIRIVLAHADRYPPEDIERLIEDGVPLQLNAECLTKPLRRRRYLSWIESGAVQYLGSDIHMLGKGYRDFEKCRSLLEKRG